MVTHELLNVRETEFFGEAVADSAIRRFMVEHGLLSGRETEILRRVSRGFSNREIADQLSITVGTTKGHLHRIFGKLDVRNRTAAVAKARELGLL